MGRNSFPGSEGSHGWYSGGKPGHLRLIRTICKLVQERGCEKYGRVVIFVTFMKESHKN